MGQKQVSVLKEGEEHPDVFYRGVEAAKEGRFTLSEVYFVRALTRHPGREFWDLLSGVVLHKPPKVNKEHPSASRRHGSEKRAPWHVGEGTPLEDAEMAPSRQAVLIVTEDDEDDAAVDHAQERAAGEAAGTNGDGRGGTRREVSFGVDSPQDVSLPLDSDLFPIMDYFRLLADVSLTYLQLLATTEYPDKVRAHAGRYCLLTISHTQMLLQCLALWKEEHVGEGGFIDLATLRKGHSGEAAAHDAVPDSFAAADTPAADTAAAGQTLEKPQPHGYSHEALLTLGLLEQKLRYYGFSALINYTKLLLRAAEATPEKRRRERICTNALVHLDAVYSSLRELARDYPDEHISKLILAGVLNAANSGRDLFASISGGSHSSHPDSVSLGGLDHRYLYASNCPWSPTHSSLIPLALSRRVRLNVQQHVPAHSLAHLRSPAQRVSFHYVEWSFQHVFVIVPGCSLYMLQHSLPDFVPGKSTMEHQVQSAAPPEAAPRASGIRSHLPRPVTHTSAYTSMKGTNRTAVISAEQGTPEEEAAAKRYRAFLRKSAAEYIRHRRFINTDLDLHEAHTTVAVSLEEACVITVSALVTSVKVHQLAGDVEASQADVSTLRQLVTGIYGPESTEWRFAAAAVQISF